MPWDAVSCPGPVFPPRHEHRGTLQTAMAVILWARNGQQQRVSAQSSKGLLTRASAFFCNRPDLFQAVAKHGRSWVAVAQEVGTRDRVEARLYANRVLREDLSLKTAGREGAGETTDDHGDRDEKHL